MKKVTLLFIVCAFLLAPHTASADIITDFVNWIIPAQLKPPPPIKVTEQGVGGILITADPIVVSGDTTRVFSLKSLVSRSFRIRNSGTLDLFLNKSNSLGYSAVPAIAYGDVPSAFALNVGEERVITITNPSTTTDIYLSKTDLGVVSTGTSVQPTVFVTNARSRATFVDNAGAQAVLASLTFNFTLNNATNKDIYVSRSINPLSFVTLSPVIGATASIKFIESDRAFQAGDSAAVYVIPAGTNRNFELTGIIDATKGTPGSKTVSVTEIHYSNSSTLLPLQSVSNAVQIRNLTVTAALASGEVQKPVITASSTPPVVAPPPAPPLPSDEPVITPSPSVSVTPSPSPSESASPTPSGSVLPSATVASTSAIQITAASTTVGSPIIENGEVIGYPVTFLFSARAVGKTIYLAKNPGMAFVTQQTGFGSLLPSLNNITTIPSIRTGDGGSYYVLPAGAVRSFQAFAVLKSDGLTKAGTQTFQITKINYGTKSNWLNEAFTVQNTANLKATVKLSPRTAAPSPSASPSASPTPEPSASGSPPASNFIALCYATPTSPETGETVSWQVMQSGGTPPLTYVWVGTDDLRGSSSLTTKKYTTPGKKDAIVSVNSGGNTITTACHVTVEQAPPSSSESPSPSTSPSPTPTSSGGVSVRIDAPERSLTASALYALGEFLDSLISH